MNGPLSVGVNALFLRPGRVGGSEIALRGLLGGLPRGGPLGRVRVFACHDAGSSLALPEGIEHERCPTPSRPRARRILWEQFGLPARVEACGAAVLWNAGFTGPTRCGVPQVTTVFDVQHLDHPQHFFPTHRWAWRAMVGASLRRSARIVCPSQFTADRLVSRAGIARERIRVVPLGVEAAFFEARDAEGDARALEGLGLEAGFLFCPSTTHPHKGHETLAAALARDDVQRALDGRRLVLTGVRGFVHDRALEALRASGLGERLTVLGWVSRSELRALYRGASAVVFPSTYEGFGLPVLEGLAAGVPVLASDLPVLREVGGDAVRWVPPSEPKALGAALVELFRDPEAARQRGAGGRLWARERDWASAAGMLAEVLGEAALAR